MTVSTMTSPLSGEHIASVISGEVAADADLMKMLASADTQTLRRMITELREIPMPTQLRAVLGGVQLSEFPAELPRDYASAQAYWWGWELFLPEKVLNQIMKVESTASGIFGLLAAASAAGLITVAAAPLLGAVAAAIALQCNVWALVDAGNGIKLAACWLDPMALIPLPIDA